MIKLILPLIALLMAGCQKKTEQKNPPGYDLNNPEKITLPESLLEISGITFLHGKSDTLLAINDEEGKLFFIDFNSPQTNSVTFHKGGGDFEDVTVYQNEIMVLRSDGVIFSFTDDFKNINSTKSNNNYPKGEYESLFADQFQHKLYVLCKKCEYGSKKQTIVGFVTDLERGNFGKTEPFYIDISSVPVKKEFKASAMTKNPLTKEWFILSSVNKMLIITDEAFNIIDTYPLDPGNFIQPEGITFDAVGNLYISNEGDKISLGNILKFRLKD